MVSSFAVAMVLMAHSTGTTPTHRPELVSAFDSADVPLLAQRAVDALHRSKQHQVYIAIAGGPGSGKSHISALVSEHLNDSSVHPLASNPNSNREGSIQGSKYMSIVIPMDGYHIPQAELKTMGKMGRLFGDANEAIGETTSFEDLMRRRGAPWTFDSERLFRDLCGAKTTGRGSFPCYDRSISDPVQDQIHVTLEHRIILCEGNYLLALDDPLWKPLSTLWDDTWYIYVSEDTTRTRLVNRHLRTWTPIKEERFGRGLDGAMAKVESSDLKNARWIHEKSKHHAALIVSNEYLQVQKNY